MSNEQAFKKRVREYACKNKVSYLVARRHLNRQALRGVAESMGEGARARVQIHLQVTAWALDEEWHSNENCHELIDQGVISWKTVEMAYGGRSQELSFHWYTWEEIVLEIVEDVPRSLAGCYRLFRPDNSWKIKVEFREGIAPTHETRVRVLEQVCSMYTEYEEQKAKRLEALSSNVFCEGVREVSHV